MPFKVLASNRLEVLSGALARVLNTPLSAPLTPEIIVVQSRGMQRWISLQLARSQHVCANVRFPFPNTFVADIARRVLTGMPDRSIYEPEALSWRIMNILPNCLKQPAFRALDRYLNEPARELKMLQLAVRIADLFDQYLLFRPEMMLTWQQGEQSHWQAILWRQLAEAHPDGHRAAVGKQLIEKLRASGPGQQPANLPERLCIFGIAALPEFYLQFFDALGEHLPVHFFLMNPCREYWGDLHSEKEQDKIVQSEVMGQLNIDFSGAQAEPGNSLLASMGRLGRDFFDLIEEEFDYEPVDAFVEPGDGSLLCCLQSDILNLREGVKSESGRPARHVIPPNDVSLQIHACHSEWREIEVLQDYLLSLFEADTALKPDDIMIMAPDIEAYEPFIRAAFDLPAADPRRIHYTIADRTETKQKEIVETFFAILDLFGSRFGASQVLNILEVPAVHEKFEIDDSGLEIVHQLIKAARIRWGIDAADKLRMGLPGLLQNTWRTGFERLLLGLALSDSEGMAYKDRIAPLDSIEGSQSTVLGNFVEFGERLIEAVRSFGRRRTIGEWAACLEGVLDDFFVMNEQTAHQIQMLRNALSDLRALQELSGYEQSVEVILVKYHLQAKLRQQGHGFGFLSGGITFCSMLPMRSIPAKVICLLGMNGSGYPRISRRLGFDLMAQSPRRGDRSVRNDDRYLFLEALLSARSHFYISFTGQSIKDNTAIPPSVLVSELLAYIERNYMVEGQEMASFLIRQHRLQAFSPKYFAGEANLFSYSIENYLAARAAQEARQDAPLFFSSESLAQPDDSYRSVSLEDLYRFLRNPVQFLFNKRLQIRLQEDSGVVEDTEAFNLRGLERYDIARMLLRRDLLVEPEMKLAQGLAGMLPHGAVGDAEYDRLVDRLGQFCQQLHPLLKSPELPPLRVAIELGGFRLSGKLAPVYRSRQMLYRYATVRAKDHLRAWLHHLVLNICAESDYPHETVLAGVSSMKDGLWAAWRLRPADDASVLLQEILALYWQNLQKPVRFFPESSLSYCNTLDNPRKNETDALISASTEWYGNQRDGAEGFPGESQNAYFNRCFGHDNAPLNKEFEETSKKICEPLLAHREEL